MILKFTEGPGALDIKLPDRWLHVVRGESVEVTEEEAILLLEFPGWEAILELPPSEEDES